MAEIRGFGGNFAPRNWAFCNGQLVSINANQALFSLLGTTYGGDGRTTFGLPDLRGRVPIGEGRGPGLASRPLGQRSGQELVYLTSNQIPSHTHAAVFTPAGAGSIGGTATAAMNVSSDNDAGDEPAGNFLGKNDGGSLYASSSNGVLDPGAITLDTSGLTVDVSGISGSVTVLNAGGSQGHNNMQPYLVIHWIICMQGLFPSRS